LKGGSDIPDRKDSGDARVGTSKPLWKAMLISFLLFWALDLLTSAILISQGFGLLEHNVFVRLFIETPSWNHFLLFLRDQRLYLIPLALAASAPIMEALTRGHEGNQFLYAPTAVVVFVYAVERLDLGVASNAANLLAILLRESLPASSAVFYPLCGAFDGLWAVWVWRYVKRQRAVVVPPLPYS
jgi:hypothetical protein